MKKRRGLQGSRWNGQLCFLPHNLEPRTLLFVRQCSWIIPQNRETKWNRGFCALANRAGVCTQPQTRPDKVRTTYCGASRKHCGNVWCRTYWPTFQGHGLPLLASFATFGGLQQAGETGQGTHSQTMFAVSIDSTVSEVYGTNLYEVYGFSAMRRRRPHCARLVDIRSASETARRASAPCVQRRCESPRDSAVTSLNSVVPT